MAWCGWCARTCRRAGERLRGATLDAGGCTSTRVGGMRLAPPVAAMITASRGFVPAAIAGLFLLSACDSEAAGTGTTETSATLAAPEGDSLLEMSVTQPEQPRLGHELTFAIRLENVSDQPVEGVKVTQQPWPGFEVLDTRIRRGAEADGESEPAAQPGAETRPARNRSADPQPASGPDGKHSWDIGSLAEGEVVALEVRGIPHEEGEHELQLEVDYDSPLRIKVDVVDPNLRLARSFERDTWWICEEIEAKYVVANTGTGTAASVTVEDQLPEGLTTEDGKNVVQFETDELGPDEKSEHTVVLKAQRPGEYSWRARATAGEVSLSTEAARLTILQPELQFTVQDPQEGLRAKLRAMVAVTIENVGDSPAEDVAVVLQEQENVEELSLQGAGEIDDQRIVIGRLEPGAKRTFNLRFRPEEPGELALTLRADARCLPEEERFVHRIATQVAGVPAARIEVVDESDPVQVGEEVVYRIRVLNQGSGVDQGIRVRATLPETLQFVGAEGATEPQADEQGNATRVVSFGTVERLEAGSDVEWELRAKAVSAGDGKLLVELRSDALGSVVKEEEPTQSIQ